MENIDLLNNSFKELFIEQKTCKSLSDCLNAMTKDQLKTLALGTHSLFGNELESVTADFIASQINNQIIAFVHYGPRELVLSTFKAIMESCNVDFPFSASVSDEIARTKDELTREILFLQSHGIIFLFKEDKKITPVIPDETVTFITQLVSADSDLAKAGDMKEFHEYAATLTELYGICPIKIFMELWNRDHPGNQIIDKAEFKKHIQNCYFITTHFYLIGNSLISPNIETTEQRNNIKEKRQDTPVYMPDAEEIKAHFRCYDYDDETESFKAIKTLLAKETKDLEYAEQITYVIFTGLKSGIDFTQIEDFLLEEYGISFTKKDSSTFNHLLLAATTQCHLWTKWGQTAMYKY